MGSGGFLRGVGLLGKGRIKRGNAVWGKQLFFDDQDQVGFEEVIASQVEH